MYSAPTVVVMAEIIKLILSTGILLSENKWSIQHSWIVRLF
jgi:hypothetical protein